MSAHLLPCPFCGGDRLKHFGKEIQCQQCQALGPLPADGEVTPEIATDWWNRRPQAPAGHSGPSQDPVQWAGWDRSNYPWSAAKHQDAVCAALFGPAWSMGEAHAAISAIDAALANRDAINGNLTPGRKFNNRADGKICTFVSVDDGLVTFKWQGRETPRYLGIAEFEKRFEPAPAPKAVAP